MSKKMSQSKCTMDNIPNPGKPSLCTFKLDSKDAESPHSLKMTKKSPHILQDILSHIGNTPLVRVNNITKKEGIECEVLVKCEYFNAGGSVKDRIAVRMIEDAEARGEIKPGDTLIEPTSGNTGIGLALAAAVKGYKCIIVMPEKMSLEKVDVLRALGAEIVRTPTSAAFDSPESNISVAYRLREELPDAHILNQYTNASNPLAHYDGTAEELLAACEGRIDMVVLGAGTGGTVTGIGRKLKQRCPSCIVVGVDPFGSILALPETLNRTEVTTYDVEGIGYDFVPTVLDRSIVDMWVKVGDRESFGMARRLIREEGLLCGGSGGCAMLGALHAIKERQLPPGARVVVLLPDSVRNYMSKFLSDDWMHSRGYLDRPLALQNDNHRCFDKKISSLNLQAPITVQPTVTVQQTLSLLKKEGFDQVPVVEGGGLIVGMATIGCMMSMLMKKTVALSDSVSKAIYKKFQKININASIGELSRLLDIDHFVLVIHQQRQITESGEEILREMIYGIVTRIDLVTFMIETDKDGSDLPEA